MFNSSKTVMIFQQFAKKMYSTQQIFIVTLKITAKQITSSEIILKNPLFRTVNTYNALNKLTKKIGASDEKNPIFFNKV